MVDIYRTEVWSQWDLQETARLARLDMEERLRLMKLAQDQAYVELNNLYLAIERGQTRLTITNSNLLRTLVTNAYSSDDHTMRDYWQREFEKLPRWFSV